MGREPIIMSFHRPIDTLGKHPTPNIICQQRSTMKARKSQLMDMSRIVIMLYSLSMPSPLSHSVIPPHTALLGKPAVPHARINWNVSHQHSAVSFQQSSLLGKPAVAPARDSTKCLFFVAITVADTFFWEICVENWSFM
jgi:hypothetical protein